MTDPDDPATTLLIEHLSQWTPGPLPLVVGDIGGRIADALSATRACSPAVWVRNAGGATAATAWPPAGPHSSALIRLPKGRSAEAFALGATASVLAPGAPIILFGMNAEGIRSAAGRLRAVAGEIGTLAVGYHARLWTGRRLADLEVPPDLSGWCSHVDLTIAGERRNWASYPGLFAADRIDEGTALLVGSLPRLKADAKVLDYGCGSGLVAAHVAALQPDVRLDLLDQDAVALVAAAQNVPGTRLILGDSLRSAGDVRYDLIVSNPPIHQGVAEDRSVLDRLIGEAPRHLAEGGSLQLVVQRRVAVAEALEAAFGNCTPLAATGQFSVFRATRTIGGGIDPETDRHRPRGKGTKI
jgi:16S rRNA (guanine1207-N2)-methyltransferase